MDDEFAIPPRSAYVSDEEEEVSISDDDGGEEIDGVTRRDKRFVRGVS